MAIFGWSLLDTILLSIALAAVFFLFQIVYRLTLHPLAKFPGPKLAAVTQWYETYYEVVEQGQWSFKINELHDIYGPIVRINPHEIHIKDSNIFDKFYTGQKQDRYDWWAQSFGLPKTSFATVEHEAHRPRRKAMQPFFTKSAIMARASVIEDKVLKLCERLVDADGSVVRIDHAFNALTTDIISEMAYGESLNLLDLPTFAEVWHGAICEIFESGGFSRHFPWMIPFMQSLPHFIVPFISPGLSQLLALDREIVKSIRKVQKEYSGSKRPDYRSAVRPTIFHYLLDSDLPESDKVEWRLSGEGRIMLTAGTETTARALAVITVHLLAEPQPRRMLTKLRDELYSIMPEVAAIPPLAELEKLPYLTAVVKEGFRLNLGVVSRNPRAIREPMEYGGYFIPAKTPVSLSIPDVLLDPDIFHDPQTFKPERWLVREVDENGETVTKVNATLDQWLVTFGKGSRQCAGINLAYAETYVTVAMMFRLLDLELYETDKKDVAYGRDCFTAFPLKESKGVRVKVMNMAK